MPIRLQFLPDMLYIFLQIINKIYIELFALVMFASFVSRLNPAIGIRAKTTW